MPEFRSLALDALRREGHRIGLKRLSVIEALDEATVPLSPQELHRVMRSMRRRIDVVTIYRLAEILVNAGVLYRVGFLDGRLWRRELTDSTILLVDAEAGEVTELEGRPEFADYLASRAAAHGYQIVGAQIEINALPFQGDRP